ncbi:MAG: universal stress protein [Burkholderiaceae bacterium]|nr:MAG: universal stress protein [Burkholderiaceae bacterium]MCC7285955.1 universal stress protein [Burkholderiaceae bacterium]
MFSRVLFPTDGSDVSLSAAGAAITMAKLGGAPLQPVYVVEPYPFTGIGVARPAGFDDYMAASRRAAAIGFERIERLAGAQGVRCEPLTVEHSRAAEGIVETAQSIGADLIVMGSHGRSGVAKLVLGSVATKVLQLSPIPVLVVKSGEASAA